MANPEQKNWEQLIEDARKLVINDYGDVLEEAGQPGLNELMRKLRQSEVERYRGAIDILDQLREGGSAEEIARRFSGRMPRQYELSQDVEGGLDTVIRLDVPDLSKFGGEI